MSRFYGKVRGQGQTEATRRGSANSGLVTECNGWDIGVTCSMRSNENGEDEVVIYMTSGSNGNDAMVRIGSAVMRNADRVFIKDGDIK